MKDSVWSRANRHRTGGFGMRANLLNIVLCLASCATSPAPPANSNPNPCADLVPAPTVPQPGNLTIPIITPGDADMNQDGQIAPAAPVQAPSAPQTVLVTVAEEGFYLQNDGALTYYPAGYYRPKNGRAKLTDPQVSNYMDHGSIFSIPSARRSFPICRPSTSQAKYSWQLSAENGSYHGEISDATARPKNCPCKRLLPQ